MTFVISLVSGYLTGKIKKGHKVNTSQGDQDSEDSSRDDQITGLPVNAKIVSFECNLLIALSRIVVNYIK